MIKNVKFIIFDYDILLNKRNFMCTSFVNSYNSKFDKIEEYKF